MMKDERPKAIVFFEALSLTSALVFMLLTESDPPFLDVFDDALMVALTLWVSRGRSRIARFLYTFVVLVFYLGIGGALWLEAISPIEPPPIIASSAVEMALLALLWWPSSTVWLNGPRERAAQ